MQIFVSEQGYGVVSVPTSACFPIGKCELSRPYRDFRELAYALEDIVPLDAEKMSIGQTGELVVVSDGEQIASWVASQELSTGQSILAVVPSSLLTLQAILDERADLPSEWSLLLIRPDSTEVLQFASGSLQGWKWLPPEPEAVRMAFDSTGANTVKSSACIVITDDNTDASEVESCSVAVTIIDVYTGKLNELAGKAAVRIHSGLQSPLVNLSSGPLETVDPFIPANGTLRGVLWAVVVVAVLLIVAINWRANRYRAEAARVVAEQEMLFKRTFPKQAIPVGILSRIESEHRKLLAMKGAGGKVPEIGSALPAMHRLWRCLPTDARYTVETIHVTPDSLKSLSGLSKGFDDLDSIRQALGNEGFQVPAVAATQTSRGVVLRLDNVPLSALVTSAAKLEEAKP